MNSPQEVTHRPFHHTPGPWELVPGPLFDEEHKQFCSITDTLGRCIAQTPVYPQGDQRFGSPYERRANEANARLIAAAPELLDLLQDFARVSLNVESQNQVQRDLIRRAQATLAAATGTKAKQLEADE